MRMRRNAGSAVSSNSQTRLARALSKLGFCSRTRAYELIREGRVSVDGTATRDPERKLNLQSERIQVDGKQVEAPQKIYLMLNKPRGLVTTASDEHGRETVFSCFEGAQLPRLFPVGRLDKASEGLLLFTNDTSWAAHVTAPETHLDKVYHVHINRLADDCLLGKMEKGVRADAEFLVAKRAKILRLGEKNSWLEIILDEGRNRHIRRLLEALGIEVLQLVRIAIGPLPLGDLTKGEFRLLTKTEIDSLSRS